MYFLFSFIAFEIRHLLINLLKPSIKFCIDTPDEIISLNDFNKSFVFLNRRKTALDFFNVFIVVLVITIGSFYPVITGVEISFFGFNDWLALYYTSFFIFIYYIIGLKKNFPYFDIYSLILINSLIPELRGSNSRSYT